MDSLSLKTAERGGIRGFDAQKRVKGRKRHILVDTFGSSPHAEWSRLTSLIETPYSQPPRTGLRLFKHPLRTETGILGKRWQLSSSAIPAIYRAGRYAIKTSDYPLRVPETIVFPERLFMRLIKGSFAGLVLAGILAMMPAPAFAHEGGGGGGHTFFGGGHAFGGFSGRGFSPGFSGTRGVSTGRFSGRADHGRFGDRGFRDHRVSFQQFAWPVYWYPYYPYDSYLDYGPDNDYQYGDNSAASVQPESFRPAVDHDPVVVSINTGNSRPMDSKANAAYINSR